MTNILELDTTEVEIKEASDILDGIKPHRQLASVTVFKNIRSRIFRRDGRQCTLCGATEDRIAVHHKDKNSANNDPSNLITLCYKCHGEQHPDLPKSWFNMAGIK